MGQDNSHREQRYALLESIKQLPSGVRARIVWEADTARKLGSGSDSYNGHLHNCLAFARQMLLADKLQPDGIEKAIRDYCSNGC